jgi:hypothetical protein
MAEHHDAAGASLPAPVNFAGLFIIGPVLNWAIPRVPLPAAVRTLKWLLVVVRFAAI